MTSPYSTSSFAMIFLLIIFTGFIVFAVVFPATVSVSSLKYNIQSSDATNEQVIVHLAPNEKYLNAHVPQVVKSYEAMPHVSSIILSIKTDAVLEWEPSEKVIINRIDNTKAAKFLGLMHMPERFKNKHHFGKRGTSDTYFFICDDDVILKDGVLEKMLKVARRSPEADVITNNPNGQFVSYFRGYVGNLVRPSFFKPELLNTALPESCASVEDKWIQFYMKTYAIKTVDTRIISTFDDKDIIVEKHYDVNTSMNNKEKTKQCKLDMALYYNNIPRIF